MPYQSPQRNEYGDHKPLDDGESVDLRFLVISKAFEIINHTILCTNSPRCRSWSFWLVKYTGGIKLVNDRKHPCKCSTSLLTFSSHYKTGLSH